MMRTYVMQTPILQSYERSSMPASMAASRMESNPSHSTSYVLP